MKLSRYILLQSVALIFSANIYAASSDLPQSDAKKIMNEWQVKSHQQFHPSNAVASLLNKHNTRRAEIFRTLQGNVKTLQNKNLFNLELLDQLGLFMPPQVNQINFTNLQLLDGVYLLEAVRASLAVTLDCLKKMANLAIQAANDTYTEQERHALNIELKEYLSALDRVQMYGVFNGVKILNKGDITIRIGNSTSPSSSVTVKMAAFNRDSLALNNIDVNSAQNAAAAFDKIQAAIKTVTKNYYISQMPNIDDMEAMLASIPTILYDDLALFSEMSGIALKAANGTLSDLDREALNMQFEYFKTALNQEQTYVSLNGVKMLGGGNVTLNIGSSTPDSSLVIKLPVADVNMLNIDKLDVKTQDNAVRALITISTITRNFVYGA